MSDATFRPAGGWPSDAPLVSTLFARPDGVMALHRKLHPQYEKDSLAVEAFRQEIRSAERLGALPGLASTLSHALEPTPWIAREWTREGTLAERLRLGPPLGGQPILGLLAAVLPALEAIEKAGATHGDPSPRNILLRSDGSVVLADGSSSRRSYAVGKLPFAAGESIADDHRVLAAWIETLARQATAAGVDPLAEDLVGALRDGGSDDARRAALVRFLASHRGEELPIDLPAASPPPRRAPAPVPVVVSVEAVGDPRVRYRVAKRLSLVTPYDAAAIRKSLEEGSFAVDSLFPEPARSLAGAAAEEGGKTAIRCRSNEVARPAGGESEANAPIGAAEASGMPPPLARPVLPSEGAEIPAGGMPRALAIVGRLLDPIRPLRELVETLGVLYVDDDEVDRPWIAKRAVKALGGLALRLAFLHAVILAVVVALGGKAGR